MFGKKKKALVLSGGGSKGAFTGGILEYYSKKLNRDYNLYVGNSTGSLLQTLASIHDFESLKKGYTTISLDDIYTVSPFKKNGSHKNPKMNLWGIFKMQILRGEATLGDSTKLKSTMKKFFPKEKFEESLDKDKELMPCVTNLSKVMTEFSSSKDVTYDEFIDWTWISTNAVPFSSLVKRNGDYYADGGYMEHMPIQKAIDEGATEIDAITTKPLNYMGNTDIEINNIIQSIQRIIEVQLWETSKRDIEVSKLRANDKNVRLNIIYAPRQLTENSMYFDKEIMEKWWYEGYHYASTGDYYKFDIPKNKRPKLVK